MCSLLSGEDKHRKVKLADGAVAKSTALSSRDWADLFPPLAVKLSKHLKP